MILSTNSDLTKVKKKYRKEVEELLKNLRKKTEKALEEGEALPNFDLCELSVPGTNLFCNGNKGFPREKMPQLKGFPIKGGKAESLLKDKNGKVDIQNQFLDFLSSRNIEVKRLKFDPYELKATQNQLVGSKIALRVKQLQKNPKNKKFTMPYFISKDGYILDGHHGWASVLCWSLIEKKQIKINVLQVNMKIVPLVKLANKFMKYMGIQTKQGTN